MPMAETNVEVEAEGLPPPPVASKPKRVLNMRTRTDKAKEEGDAGTAADEPFTFADEEPAVRPPSTSAPRQQLERSRPDSKQRAQNQSLRDWISGLGAGTSFRIQVNRTRPENFRGKKVNGFLGTHDTYITDEDIQQQYGGGTYQVRIQVPDNNGGSWVYFASTTVDVAGDPRLDTLANVEPEKPVTPSTSPLIERMIDRAEDRAQRAEEMAARARSNDGGNVASQIALAMEPLKEMMRNLNAQIAAKDATIADLMKPKETVENKFAEKILMNGDTRLVEQRTQYESEMRMLKENHREDLKRLEDRLTNENRFAQATHERELSNTKASYERELSNMKSSFERELANLKQSSEMLNLSNGAATKVQQTVLESDNRRLEKRNDELEKELRELRAKKELSFSEKVKEIQSVKDILDVGGDDKEESTIDKVVKTVVGSEQAMGAIGRMFGPGEAKNTVEQAQVQQVQAARPRRSKIVRRKSDGAVFQRTAEGLVPVKSTSAEGKEEPVHALDESKVLFAVSMIEQAYRNGVDPATFATTTRSAIPDDIMLAIRRDGVDGFLQKSVQLEAGSPLNSQAGRNWIRKVGKELTGEE